MKLSLISEMDSDIRKLSRAVGGGDIEALGSAMRIHARSRPQSTWKEPGINKNSKRLRSHGQDWKLETYPFTISYNSGMTTRRQAVATALHLLRQTEGVWGNTIEIGRWAIYDEDEDEDEDDGSPSVHNHYLGIDIAVPSSFIKILMDAGNDILWETDDGTVVLHVETYEE